MSKRAFGELELQILHILKSGNRLTVKDVQKILGGCDNYNTVMTVMNRLTEKKQLARERCGLQYEYWILDQIKNVSIFEKFKERFFGISTPALVSYLIDSADDLSDEDLAQMEKTLAHAKKQRRKE